MKWGFPYGSAGIESACNSGDLGLIPGLGRSPGEGKGYPCQYSSLENSMDCIIHGVAKNQTQLSDFYVNEMILFVFYYIFQHVGDSFMSDVPMPGHLSELQPVNEVNTKGQVFRASFGKNPRFQRQLDKRPLSPGTPREASGVPCLNPRLGLTLLSPVCRDPAIGYSCLENFKDQRSLAGYSLWNTGSWT